MKPTNNDPTDAFIAAKAEIDDLLARLTALSNDNLGSSMDHIHWGHVASAQQLSAMLLDAAAFIGA